MIIHQKKIAQKPRNAHVALDGLNWIRTFALIAEIGFGVKIKLKVLQAEKMRVCP